MNACTCEGLAWLLNAQRGAKYALCFQYCLEPQDGTPVSRIMRRGCVAPPSMRLYTLLENLVRHRTRSHNPSVNGSLVRLRHCNCAGWRP